MKKILSLALAPLALFGHYAWMEPAHFGAPTKEPLRVQVGWGHDFGTQNRLELERVEAVFLDNAPLAKADEYTYETPLLKEGVYVLEGIRKAGYSTKTPDGRKRLPKNEVKNPLQCGYTKNRFFALIGEGEKRFSTGSDGLDVQVLNTTWPLVTKTQIALKISFEGQPLETEVVAVYAGYESKGGEYAYPISQKTDAKGQAVLSFERGGKWLIKVATSLPYPDTNVCDNLNYITTLVIEVAP